MKNTLVMLIAVATMAVSCTSRTYVNRAQPRRYATYGHHNDHNRYERDRYDHRYDRGW